MDTQAKTFGYSYFPLFVNKKTGKQPKSRSESAMAALQDGHYQIPIYCQELGDERPFYVKDL